MKQYNQMINQGDKMLLHSGRIYVYLQFFKIEMIKIPSLPKARFQTAICPDHTTHNLP